MIKLSSFIISIRKSYGIIAYKLIFTVNVNNEKYVLNLTKYKFCTVWSFSHNLILCKICICYVLSLS